MMTVSLFHEHVLARVGASERLAVVQNKLNHTAAGPDSSGRNDSKSVDLPLPGGR